MILLVATRTIIAWIRRQPLCSLCRHVCLVGNFLNLRPARCVCQVRVRSNGNEVKKVTHMMCLRLKLVMALHKMTSLTETAAFIKLPAQMYQSTTDAQVWLDNPITKTINIIGIHVHVRLRGLLYLLTCWQSAAVILMTVTDKGSCMQQLVSRETDEKIEKIITVISKLCPPDFDSDSHLSSFICQLRLLYLSRSYR